MGSAVATDGIFDDDDTTFDTSGVSPDELDSGGMIDEEGYYHCICNGVTKFAEEGKLKNLRVDFQVCPGVDSPQKSRMMFHRVYLQGWKDRPAEGVAGVAGPLSAGAMKSLLRFAIGMNLIKKEDIGSTKLSIPWHLLEGRQAVIHVKKEKKTDAKTGKEIPGQFECRIAYGEVYPVDHERVASVKKDPDFLALAGASGGDGSELDDI